jgi:hypothetical protein
MQVHRESQSAYTTTINIQIKTHRFCLLYFETLGLFNYSLLYTRAFCKVSGLSLLLRVGTLWRCGDGLFFEVTPLASDALLENVLQTVDHFEISCLVAPFSWFEKPRNRTGRDLNWILCSAWNPIRTPAIQSRSHPMRFLGFSNHEKEAPRQEI